MTDIVVDASAAAAWLLKSQETAASIALSASWADHAGFAPHLFLSELRALLLAAERRERAGAAAMNERLESMTDFNLEIAPPLDGPGMDEVITVARRCGAGFSDAQYIDLALQLGAAVATRDRGMLTAARRLGLEVFDLRHAALH